MSAVSNPFRNRAAAREMALDMVCLAIENSGDPEILVRELCRELMILTGAGITWCRVEREDGSIIAVSAPSRIGTPVPRDDEVIEAGDVDQIIYISDDLSHWRPLREHSEKTTNMMALVKVGGKVFGRLVFEDISSNHDFEIIFSMLGIVVPVCGSILAGAMLQRAQEETIQRQDIIFRSLAENALEGIAIFSPVLDGNDGIEDFKWEMANPVSAAYFNHSPDTIVGETIIGVYPDLAGTKEFYRGESVLKTGRPERFVMRLKYADDDFRWLDVSMIRVENNLAVIFSDITEMKRQEAEKMKFEHELLQTQKFEGLGVLAGGIAHDFNNLLTIILGNAEMLGDDMEGNDRLRKSLGAINNAARRAADLCQQMLTYTGKSSFNIKSVNLNLLTTEIFELIKLSVPSRCRIKVDFDERLPDINGDPDQIRQMIVNLVTNASEAVGDGDGDISLSTDKKFFTSGELPRNPPDWRIMPGGEYIRLTVRDTGAGMDGKTIERIFEPFFSTKFTGRGLGLSAVLGIVKTHHGAIGIESKPGGGSVFTVFLPVSPRRRAEQKTSDGSGLKKGNGEFHILLVDDEESLLEIGTQMLETLGAKVTVAEDGVEALKIIQNSKDDFDLALIDLTMPGKDGIRTLCEIRETAPGLPVFIASGYNEAQVEDRCDTCKPDGVIRKPYSLAKLRSLLHKIR